MKDSTTSQDRLQALKMEVEALGFTYHEGNIPKFDDLQPSHFTVAFPDDWTRRSHIFLHEPLSADEKVTALQSLMDTRANWEYVDGPAGDPAAAV